MISPILADTAFVVGSLTVAALVTISILVARRVADLEWQKRDLVRQQTKLEGEIKMLRAELRDCLLWRER